MLKVLILGGKTGMLGQALMREALHHDVEAFSFGREDCISHSHIPVNKSTQKNEIRLTRKCLENEIARINPDVIFNAIAYTAVDQAEDDSQSAFLINKDLPIYLADILQGSSCHLIHYSTDFVFDGTKKTPYLESDVTNPLSIYGKSKLDGEQILLQYNKTTILRTAWLFGRGKKNFVSTMINFAKERPLLRVVNDQRGCPTSTKSLAQMSFLISQKKQFGLFNGVNSGSATWFDLAKEAISLYGLNTNIEPITTQEWPQKAIRPPYSVLSMNKFSATLEYTVLEWKTALAEYIDEVKQHNEF